MIYNDAMKYHKLVRDNIPDIIKANGGKATVHTATKREYQQKLGAKLREEVEEFLQQPNEEELADIREVLDALIELHQLDEQRTRALQAEKAAARGRFAKRLILDETAGK